jgi:hypothetical protein
MYVHGVIWYSNVDWEFWKWMRNGGKFLLHFYYQSIRLLFMCGLLCWIWSKFKNLDIYFSWSDFGWFVGFSFCYESGCGWDYFWKSIKCSLDITLLNLVCLVGVGWLVLEIQCTGEGLSINVLVLVDVISSFERIRVIFLELLYFINIL